LSDLTDAQRSQLKIKGGIRIESVDGAAARAGLREGDVILTVANTEVGSVKEFESVVAKQDKNRPVSLLIRRGEWAQYVVIRPNGR
jgi:serine protease Do